jgi:hypothetical protein
MSATKRTREAAQTATTTTQSSSMMQPMQTSLVQDMCANIIKAVEDLSKALSPDNVQLNVASQKLTAGSRIDLGEKPKWAASLTDHRRLL